jgi:hypothetical protein
MHFLHLLTCNVIYLYRGRELIVLGENIRHVGEVGETAAGHVRLHVGQRFLYK